MSACKTAAMSNETATNRPTPAGAERLLQIVNAPATGNARPFSVEPLARCEANTFRTMARCGLPVMRNPEHTLMTTPHDFGRLLPATRGALQGTARPGTAGRIHPSGRARAASCQAST